MKYSTAWGEKEPAVTWRSKGCVGTVKYSGRALPQHSSPPPFTAPAPYGFETSGVEWD